MAPAEIDRDAEAAFEALVRRPDRQHPPTGSPSAGRPNVCSPTIATVERRYELDNLWRSIAMLTPNARAVMSREEALELLEELGDLHRRIEALRTELRRLADDL